MAKNKQRVPFWRGKARALFSGGAATSEDLGKFLDGDAPVTASVVTTKEALEEALDDFQGRAWKKVEESTGHELSSEERALRWEEALKEYRGRLKLAFESAGIPIGFLQVAESLGVSPDDDEVFETFKQCIWKGKEEPNAENVKEAKNWMSLYRYSGIATQRLLTEELRKLVCDFSFYWKDRSPAFGGAIRQIRRFVIGRGVKTKVQIKEVEDAWKAFLKKVRWEERQKEFFEYAILCGECFFAVHTDREDGYWLELIPYFELDFDDAVVLDPKHRDRMIGVTRRLVDGDKESYKVYKVTDFDDEETFPAQDDEKELQEDVQVLYKRLHGNSDEYRGRPTYHVVLKWIKILDDFIQNRARLNDFQSRVLLKKIHTEGGSAKATAAKIQQLPSGGTILNETSKLKYEYMSPQINAGQVVDDMKAIMYMVCAGFESPMHVVFQNAENNNFASIQETDTPWTAVIQDRQDDWGDMLKALFQFFLKIALENKELEAEYEVEEKEPDGTVKKTTVKTEECSFEAVFPEIVKQKVAEKVSETRELVGLRVMSRSTAAARHDLDYEKEKKAIAQEEKERMEQMEAEWQKSGVVDDGGEGDNFLNRGKNKGQTS